MSMDLRQSRILVTREKNQAAIFAEKITQASGRACVVDLLKINCICPNQVPADHFDWIFFTSIHGVHCFFKNIDFNIQAKRFAVVGPKTNEALAGYGYTADFMPITYNAKTMAEEFLKQYGKEQTVLLVRGTIASPVLVDAFHQAGMQFSCLEVYETVLNVANRVLLNEVLIKNKIDFITFTSPSTVEAFMSIVENPIDARKITTVCIGTTTEKCAVHHGFINLLVPDQFTIEGMLKVMDDYVAKEGRM